MFVKIIRYKMCIFFQASLDVHFLSHNSSHLLPIRVPRLSTLLQIPQKARRFIQRLCPSPMPFDAGPSSRKSLACNENNKEGNTPFF
jgi:hypothetical protein